MGDQNSVLRSLLVLGRVSNLPTVWSNCLVGWWINGGRDVSDLILLSLAASLIYIGGMYGNDFVDAAFDSEHRKERPIPSGILSRKTVGMMTCGWIFSGLLLLLYFELKVVVAGLVLILTIAIYNVLHKKISWSPWLMAGCRFWLIIMAAYVGEPFLAGYVVWVAVALFCYIVGLSYLARQESLLNVLNMWPCLFLGVPLLLAWLVNDADYRAQGLFFSFLLAGWVGLQIYHAFSPSRRIGTAVSGLLAGICLVDWLAVLDAPAPVMLAFPILFVLSLVAQRFIPAT